MKKIFIQTNHKQLLGAKLAKFAMEREQKGADKIPVEIMNVDTSPYKEWFTPLYHKPYLRSGKEYTFDPNDLQSFTITRFLPPELMHYEGHAVVIDPDIFTLVDPHMIFDIPLNGHAIAACRKKDAWDTSVMLLDCKALRHWSAQGIIHGLIDKTIDYTDLMMLKKELSVTEIPRVWNNLDHLDDRTKLLHTTNRLTQPWKTGLPIDFTRYPMKKIFGVIPREWILACVGKYPNTYQRHPDRHIEKFFFTLVRDALTAGAVTEKDIEYEIQQKHVRQDLLQKIRV